MLVFGVRFATRLLTGLSLWAASVSGLAEQAEAQGQGRTLKVVYAYAAGNSGDALARVIADRLGARLGMPAIVENRAGASGRLGTKAVIAADPDGTTLLISPMAPIVLHPVTYSNLGYEPFTALAAVSQVATFDIALAVGPAVRVQTLRELVGWLKSNPDKAVYANPGLGGLPHFFAVMFAGSAGVALRNVPYRGGGAVLTDVVAGQLPIAVVTTSDVSELHSSQRVRVLATSGRERSSFLPNVPTFREAGFNIAGEGWYGLYAPARTPRDLIDKLSGEVQTLLKEAEVRARIQSIGLVPTGTSAEELARMGQEDRALWLPAIQASGFKPTD